MKISKQIFLLLGMIVAPSHVCLAYSSQEIINKQIYSTTQYNNISLVQQKTIQEKHIPLPYIGIAFHKPNYILPFYYTGSPDHAVYVFHTPNNESIKSSEVKYQISLKTPLLKAIYNDNSSLYFAFTLLTYWQVYNKSPFIRETNYEPEFFLHHTVNYPLYPCWTMNFVNVGYSHQSNGWGNHLQRSWDRIYLEAVTSINNWMISFKPWYIVLTYDRNENISSYLGYASTTAAYQYLNQVFSVQITNLGVPIKRTTANLTWSVPLTPYIKIYAEVFSGYGQSLIEYNHRTNSIGIGFALNDWI